jgi:hypothetical protein
LSRVGVVLEERGVFLNLVGLASKLTFFLVRRTGILDGPLGIILGVRSKQSYKYL